MKRTLTLKKELLCELTADELNGVGGGTGTGDPVTITCTVCTIVPTLHPYPSCIC